MGFIKSKHIRSVFVCKCSRLDTIVRRNCLLSFVFGEDKSFPGTLWARKGWGGRWGADALRSEALNIKILGDEFD